MRLNVNVNQSGIVSVTLAGQTAPQQIGQLTLANFPNPGGLAPLGSNLFQQTEASGQPVAGVPGDPGFAHDPARLSGSFECRSGGGDHRSDQRAARL